MSQAALKLAQAQSLLSENKPEAALAIAQRLASKAPADPDINSMMGMVLLRLGRLDQAIYYCRRAASSPTATPNQQTNLAIVLVAAGKIEEGRALLERVVQTAPQYHEARLALMNLLLEDRHAAAAMALCREGLNYGWHPQLSVSYAAAHTSLAQNEDAVRFLHQAIAQFPNETYLAASLCLALNAMYGASPDEIADAHRSYGALLNRVKPPFRAAYVPKKEPDRKLRVALVSPDFRQHSVAFFIESFLEHFDRTQLEVVCYSTNRTFDAVSERLKSRSTLWRDASAMIELQLAAKMSEDRIDIAIDLAGHTEGNSLQAFSLRMAPIQVTYLGYPDTTGLTQMDYRVVDSLTDPPSPAADARHTEKLVRIDPCFLCYRPHEDSPKPARDPAFPGPTFGSFNAGRKLSGPVLKAWARILLSVPGSRLLLKAQDFGDPAIPQRIYDQLRAGGVDEQRVEILKAPKSMAEHLGMYGRVDVGLDPMPYNGTTTTCEALWMGVPVVTLAGNRHAGRVGVSLLMNIGAPELIAGDLDQYIRLASELAQDTSRLTSYRESLRSRVAASPLCDGPVFAQRLGKSLRAMWQEYCTKP